MESGRNALDYGSVHLDAEVKQKAACEIIPLLKRSEPLTFQLAGLHANQYTTSPKPNRFVHSSGIRWIPGT